MDRPAWCRAIKCPNWQFLTAEDGADNMYCAICSDRREDEND